MPETPVGVDPLLSRACHAVRVLLAAERAAVYLYSDMGGEGDAGAERLHPVAAAGVPLARLREVHSIAGVAPAVRAAVGAGKVVQIPREELPGPYAEALCVEGVTCAPVALAGRRYGAIFADRGGSPLALDAERRGRLRSIAKLTAMVASSRDAAPPRPEGERSALVGRLELAREIHDEVMPGLSAVSLALHADARLPEDARREYGERLGAALSALRATIAHVPEREQAASPERSLGALLRGLADRHPGLPVRVHDSCAASVPAHVAALADHFLNETLTNASKHARPSRVDVRVDELPDVLRLEVENDGLQRSDRAAGVGLRLVALHALEHGALVEFGASGGGTWRARLSIPMEVHATWMDNDA